MIRRFFPQIGIKNISRVTAKLVDDDSFDHLDRVPDHLHINNIGITALCLDNCFRSPYRLKSK